MYCTQKSTPDINYRYYLLCCTVSWYNTYVIIDRIEYFNKNQTDNELINWVSIGGTAEAPEHKIRIKRWLYHLVFFFLEYIFKNRHWTNSDGVTTVIGRHDVMFRTSKRYCVVRAALTMGCIVVAIVATRYPYELLCAWRHTNGVNTRTTRGKSRVSHVYIYIWKKGRTDTFINNKNIYYDVHLWWLEMIFGN